MLNLVALDLNHHLVLGSREGVQHGAGLDAALQGRGHVGGLQAVRLQVLDQRHLLVGAPRGDGEVDGLHVALPDDGRLTGEHHLGALVHFAQGPVRTKKGGV